MVGLPSSAWEDEFGAAPYASSKGDMKMLVDVIESSMGRGANRWA